MKIGNREFDISGAHTYVMGILNVTPDSFSDGGRWNDFDSALFHVEEMISDGADIIDIGGESTRPGYTRISDDEEIERTAPIIEKIKARFDIPLSLDTYKSAVAKGGILAGADLINDIWGLKADEQMGGVIAGADIPCCLMHNRDNTAYESFVDDVIEELEECVRLAKTAGISDDKIILDPGVGFGKTTENNLEIISKLDKLKTLNYPLLLGCSRKSVIGNTLGLPVDERLEGTLVTSVYGVLKGASFIRVHDVKENIRAVRMAEAIRNSGI